MSAKHALIAALAWSKIMKEVIELPPLTIFPKITGAEVSIGENGEVIGEFKTEPYTEEEIRAYFEKHVLQFFNRLTSQ
jgi:hypothetical protein